MKQTVLTLMFCCAAASAVAQDADKTQPAKDADKLPTISSRVEKLQRINWVHRATRGWSYGGRITDPRTGEMILQLIPPAASGYGGGIKSLAGAVTTAHGTGTREDITRFLSRPADAFKKTDPLTTPAGEPIGGKGGR